MRFRTWLSCAVVAVVAVGCRCGEDDPLSDAGVLPGDAGLAVDAGGNDAGPLDAGEPDAGGTDAGTGCLLDGGVTGTRCGNACVDLAVDPLHCGTCEQVCAPGAVCKGQCLDVVGSLDGLRWELPCQGPVRSDGISCVSPARFDTSTVAMGAAGARYRVTLHVRGVVEQRTYVDAGPGGASAGPGDGGLHPDFFVEGGEPAAPGDPYNLYTLAVEYPVSGAATKQYRLNAGVSGLTFCDRIDYLATIEVETGSTLALSADAIEGTIIANLDPMGQPIVVPDVPPAPAAFDGQFVQVDVVSVTAVR